MASSSILQPDDVLVSVASPLASGRSAVGARAARNCSGDAVGTEHAQSDGDRQHGGRRGSDHEQTTRHFRAAPASLSLDARPQSRRCLHLFRRTPHERDRPLLLGESVGELRRRRHLCLERRATLRRERSVRKRRQLDDLLRAVLVFSTTSHSSHSLNDPVQAWLFPPATRFSHAQSNASASGIEPGLSVSPVARGHLRGKGTRNERADR